MEEKECSPRKWRRPEAERSDRCRNACRRPPVRFENLCRLNSPSPHPQEQQHQPPKMISKIGAPVQELPDTTLQRIPTEQAGCLAILQKRILQQGPQGAAQPFMRRKIEPYLLPAQRGRR